MALIDFVIIVIENQGQGVYEFSWMGHFPPKKKFSSPHTLPAFQNVQKIVVYRL